MKIQCVILIPKTNRDNIGTIIKGQRQPADTRPKNDRVNDCSIADFFFAASHFVSEPFFDDWD
jgi:hypothetical protein